MRILWIAPLFVCLASGQTLTLKDALELAARQNPNVQLARLRVIEREAQARSLKAGYLPQANITASGGYQTNNLQGMGLVFPGSPSRIGPYSTFNARPVVTQQILDLPLLAGLRAARGEAAAAKLDIEAVREETQAAVINLYLQTFQAQSRLRAAQARVKSAEALLGQAAEREQAGSSSKLDVARNRKQRETEQLSVVAAGQDLRLIRPALAELLGAPVEGELAEPSLGMPETAAIRPDLQAQEARIGVASHQVDQAKRERWPKLGSFGDFGVLGASPVQSTSTYTVGATLNIPVWTSGRIDADVKAAQSRVEQRREELRRLQLAAARQAEQAQITYEKQEEAARTAEAAATAARQSLELARLRFESGMATSVDTVTAQSALAEAEESSIRARYEAQIALARLAFAKGDVKAALR